MTVAHTSTLQRGLDVLQTAVQQMGCCCSQQYLCELLDTDSDLTLRCVECCFMHAPGDLIGTWRPICICIRLQRWWRCLCA